MRAIIEQVQASNDELVTRLSEALGHIQFQDVVRQRVEQVELALRELTEHTGLMAGRLSDPGWDGRSSPTLKERLDLHMANYVMSSQRQSHTATLGGPDQGSSDGPAIELF
jgi:methyl-accepting chemotaxis protein